MKGLKTDNSIFDLVTDSELERANEILEQNGKNKVQRLKRYQLEFINRWLERLEVCKYCNPSECPFDGLVPEPYVVNGIFYDVYAYCSKWLRNEYQERVQEKIGLNPSKANLIEKAFKKSIDELTIDECKAALSML